MVNLGEVPQQIGDRPARARRNSRGQPGNLTSIDEGRRIAVESVDELVYFHLRMLSHPRYGRAMTDVEKQLNSHAQIADRIIGNIVQAKGPALSPDGSTVAFVVSRIDMAKNKTFSQVWLAATDGSSAPRARHRRRARRRAGVEPRRPIARLRFEARREE